MPGEVHLQQLLDIGGDMHRLDRGQASRAARTRAVSCLTESLVMTCPRLGIHGL
jgi:hypothetical protein